MHIYNPFFLFLLLSVCQPAVEDAALDEDPVKEVNLCLWITQMLGGYYDMVICLHGNKMSLVLLLHP